MASTHSLVGAPVSAPPPATGLISRYVAYCKTSPGKLLNWLLTIAALLALTLIMAVVTYSDMREAVQTVGKDTVPSIVAAENIRATIADANAYAVNAFLEQEHGIGKNRKKYRDDMNAVHDSLVTSAQNITYGQQERQPILTIMSTLGEYERLIGLAQEQAPADALATLTQAQGLIHQTILPEAIALDQANFSHLTSTYDAHRQHTSLQQTEFVWIVGPLLIMALFGVQLHLYRTTKRVFNLPLLGATFIAVVYLLQAMSSFRDTETALVRAKQDAFDSVHALWQARAVAYDANADESLYLLSHGNDADQQQSTQEFKDKVAQLSAGDVASDRLAADNKLKFAGFLGDELDNVTFDGEGDAALQTIHTWAAYIAIDDRIRQLEQGGDHAAAIALNLGTHEGESNWAFAQFDTALGKTLDINQQAFDQATAEAFGHLDHFPLITAIAGALIALASLFGLKSRFDEYRF